MTLCVHAAQSPLRPRDVRVTEGFAARRYRANVEGSIRRFDIDRYVGMLERPAHRDWWWIGEQPGKWLESAVLSAESTGDAGLASLAAGVLGRVVAAQAADGYLGVTDPVLRTAERPWRGMDPYEQYFTLHGLMTAHECLGEASALTAAARLADYYLAHAGPGRHGFWPSPIRPPHNRRTVICRQFTHLPTGTPHAPELHWQSDLAGHTAHYGWEGTLIIDPVMRLYGLTGDARYLDFVRWVVSRIDEWSGWDAFSRLDEVASGSAGVHELQPYVHAHTFHMNFLGFLRLYEATGDASLLAKVEGAWRDIASRQLYITGGVSSGEHYKPGFDRPVSGDVVETCANMSWMQLTQRLLELTDDPAYADVVERLLLNHVFASQTVDGDSYRYHTPPNGTKPHRYFHGPDCCTSSGHRLVSMLPKFLCSQAPGVLTVNQYVACVARADLGPTGVVPLRIETDYPENDTVPLTLEHAAPARFSLRLRIPAWCPCASVRVDGVTVADAPAPGYLTLDRTWSPGTRIELRLPMEVRWVEHDHFPGPDAPVALTRGPVVYALDTVFCPLPSATADDLALVPSPGPATREVPLAAGHLGPALSADLLTSDRRELRATLVPFANAGVWYRDPLDKPDPESSAFAYAVWLRKLPPSP